MIGDIFIHRAALSSGVEGIFKEARKVQEETSIEMPDFCAAYGLNQD
ncbi:MAG: hypothetical protein ACRC4N_00110 [Gammaproteobacteria bacterium]